MMDNYLTWYRKANEYLSGVKGKNGNPSKFSTTIQYNMIAMAFESYAMAILDYHNKLPENHTISDLLNALDNVISLNASLRNRIIKHEEVQLICPVVEYKRREPSIDEVNEFRELIEEISSFTAKIIDIPRTISSGEL